MAVPKNEYVHTTSGVAGYDQLLGFPIRTIHARGETVKSQGEIKSYKPDQEYYFKEGCFINELSNDPANPEISIARARVEPGKITRWHYLRETTERYLIISGSGLVDLGEQPSASVSVGDVVLIPSGVRQRIRNVGMDDLVFLAICCPRFLPMNYVDCAES